MRFLKQFYQILEGRRLLLATSVTCGLLFAAANLLPPLLIRTLIQWVTEDGGRLFKKRNLHWIVQYKGKASIPGKRYKWLTLWEIDKLIKLGPIVGPHLRSILSLI